MNNIKGESNFISLSLITILFLMSGTNCNGNDSSITALQVDGDITHRSRFKNTETTVFFDFIPTMITKNYTAMAGNSLTYIPDDNFEQALIDLGYDSGSLDDYVLTSNINTLTTLNISNNGIVDLTGIESFLALTELRCNNNQLTTLNVTQNTSLIDLRCNNNDLTDLNLSQNTVLRYLNCSNNSLTNLDLSQNIALTNLSCRNNDLTSLNITQNIGLTHLYCADNSLPTLNTINNTVLTQLNCSSNDLTSLNLTQNVHLQNIYCNYNNLTDLDTSFNPALENLQCYNNQLAILDVSQNTVLNRLACNNNLLSALDVSLNTTLINLLCYNNQLTYLNSKNGNNTNITSFIATGNPNLTCIEVDNANWSTTNWTNIDTTSTFVNNQSECAVLAADEFHINNFSTYPNPSKGTITINTLEETILTIYTINGNKVLKRKLAKGSNKLSNLNLTSGIYLFRLSIKNQYITKKIIIK